MAKYIISIPDGVKWIQYIQQTRNAQNLKVESVCDLTPYTEPDRKDIENEVWQFALKLMEDVEEPHFRSAEMVDCFCKESALNVMMDGYQEAKSKYEAWMKQKEEIHVGDEVKSKETEWRGVVTNVDQNGDLIIMDNSGETGRYYKAKHFEKTGRHFTEIEELLKKMKGESE